MAPFVVLENVSGFMYINICDHHDIILVYGKITVRTITLMLSIL